MNDHGLEQMVHFPTREKNILDLILPILPGQFQDVHSPDKLSDHDIVSGTLKIFIPPPPQRNLGERCIYIRKLIMNLWEKTYLSLQRKNTSMFNGQSDTRSVQENFDWLTCFIHDSVDKHIPSKTSR